jgi:co-chaperonin GroES (HSP10)
MDTTVFDEIEVLDGFILFQFEEEIDPSRHNAFTEKTQSGIILPSNPLTAGQYARWATVVAVGPNVPEDVVPGSKVCIEALKWTKVSTYKGEEFARTEAKFILAVGE